MRTRLNKTSICSILCVDIVGHSRRPDAEQVVQKERFNALVEASLAGVPKNDRAILDTGDGVLIAFFGAPEDALTVALLIRDGIAEDSRAHPGHPIQLRTGINLGPVRVVPDINGALNIVGDGLNAAQQVMGFAAPDRILVARSYHEIVAPESPDIARMLPYFGSKIDRDEREYEMYIVGLAESKAQAGWRERFAARFTPPLIWLRAGTLGVISCMLAGSLLLSRGGEAVSDGIPLAGEVQGAAPILEKTEAQQEQKEPIPQHASRHAKRNTAGYASGRRHPVQAPEPAREAAPEAPPTSVACTEGARMLNQCG